MPQDLLNLLVFIINLLSKKVYEEINEIPRLQIL